jgi:EAL domain-containing protein (putative c-di-GMP-specific phosphodiesterase class I)
MPEGAIRWGMFSLSAFLDASIIKLNSEELRLAGNSVVKQTVTWMVSAARRIGVHTLMAGVSDCQEFEWAKRMGVDYVQGALFDR